MYEPQEYDEYKHHFDIIISKAVNDILNEPRTLEIMKEFDEQPVGLYQ